MAFPDFDALTDRLFATCEDMLGDCIEFRAAGGDWSEIKAHVDYGEAVRDAGTGIVIDNAITVNVLKATLPARPSGDDRMKLPKIPGIAFRPIGVLDLGREWTFGVQRV